MSLESHKCHYRSLLMDKGTAALPRAMPGCRLASEWTVCRPFPTPAFPRRVPFKACDRLSLSRAVSQRLALRASHHTAAPPPGGVEHTQHQVFRCSEVEMFKLSGINCVRNVAQPSRPLPQARSRRSGLSPQVAFSLRLPSFVVLLSCPAMSIWPVSLPVGPRV